MFAPTRVWRKWHVKTNQNQKRFATVSALAATAIPSLVLPLSSIGGDATDIDDDSALALMFFPSNESDIGIALRGDVCCSCNTLLLVLAVGELLEVLAASQSGEYASL